MIADASAIKDRLRRNPETALPTTTNRRLLLLLLILASCPVYSDSPLLLILQSGSAPVYQEVTRSILTSVESICSECRNYRISQANIEDEPLEKLLEPDGDKPILLVTIGVNAARRVAELQSATPRLYTLIPLSTAASLNMDESSASTSAIYLDQPFTRHLNLIKLIGTGKQVVGVLFGPVTQDSSAVLKLAAAELGISIRQETVTEQSQVGPALRRLLEESDLLLALPDPLVYNQNTIFNILLSSYHNQVPVVGFSASYVKAGALLAVYSTPSNIGRQIAETIRQFVTTGSNALPDAAFPRYFSIEVNRNVARSLDIDLPSAIELQKHLEQLEER